MTGLVYVGSLADDGGITVARRGPGGDLTRVGHVPAEAPSFLAAHPTLPVLYAVHGTGEGTVAAYDVAPGGDLTLRAVLPTHGVEPCHLAVAPDGSALAVANYADGVVSVRALDPSGRPAPDAALLRHEGGGPHPERQRGPHAHMCHYTADGLLHVVDLGADRVHRYGRDLSPHPAGPVPMPAGSGPRHIAGDGRGHWYVAGELDATVSGWAEEAGGWRRVSVLPATGTNRRDDVTGPDGSTASAWPGETALRADSIHVADAADSDPSDAAGPASDRAHGPAAAADAAIEAAVREAVEAAVAALGAPIPGPRPGDGDGEGADVDYPSHIALSPDGRLVYVAVRGSDTIGVFRVNAGRLTPLAEVSAGGRWPRHFAFAGEHLYVANQDSDEVTAFLLRDGVPERPGAALRVPAPACLLPWDRPAP